MEHHLNVYHYSLHRDSPEKEHTHAASLCSFIKCFPRPPAHPFFSAVLSRTCVLHLMVLQQLSWRKNSYSNFLIQVKKRMTKKLTGKQKQRETSSSFNGRIRSTLNIQHPTRIYFRSYFQPQVHVISQVYFTRTVELNTFYLCMPKTVYPECITTQKQESAKISFLSKAR